MHGLHSTAANYASDAKKIPDGVATPGWGTLPSKPEAAADFEYTLPQDLVRPRYRLTLKAQTHLVPTDLNYTEIGDGSRGHLDGIDFMFDPRPVNRAIPSWRVATRQRHHDLLSPLRVAHKLLAPGADVTVENDTVLPLRETGKPPVRIFLDETTGRPVKFAWLKTIRHSGTPSSRCTSATTAAPARSCCRTA